VSVDTLTSRFDLCKGYMGKKKCIKIYMTIYEKQYNLCLKQYI